MKTVFVALFAVMLFIISAAAVERIELMSPDQAKPGTMSYRLVELNLNWEQGVVVIVLFGVNNERREIVYTLAEGSEALLRGLNRPSVGTKSLQRIILDRLIADGHLVGAIRGVPD